MTSDEPARDDLPEGPLPPAAKPERPRDEAGRPLAWDAPTRLHLPNFDAMTLDECHAEAIRLFDAGNYFGAHEAWETCWAFAKGTDEEEFFKGLAQLGAGYTHWLRGNAHGVVALLGRALARIDSHGATHRELDVAAFAARLEDLRDQAGVCERDGAPLPEMERRPVPQT
ncbi:MAG: DUF309 domain-containing protein [Dehalococcoidia bacterium]